MVQIKLFDVDHGFCAAIEANERHTMLLDCGYSFRTGFRPARYLLNQRSRQLDYLVIPAYTEGSLTGFLDLNSHFAEHYFSIEHLLTNPSIKATSLLELTVRNPGLGQALRLLDTASCGHRKPAQTLQWQNCKLSFFWNTYPDCLDLRDLSLVAFLSYQDIHMVFPSALKTEGWRKLLKKPAFCDCLRQVNLFVAANHGQENGYCPEVFHHCTPDLVIISNHLHRQLPDSILRQYERHARGCRTALGRQKVITTCDAGSITIHQSISEALRVTQKHEIYQYQTS